MIFHLEICSMSSYRKDVLVSKCKYISINLESLPSSGQVRRKLLWTPLRPSQLSQCGTTMVSLQLRYFGCGPLIKIKLHLPATLSFTPSLTLALVEPWGETHIGATQYQHIDKIELNRISKNRIWSDVDWRYHPIWSSLKRSVIKTSL